MVFDKELFNKCLDFIESAMQECLICDIDINTYDFKEDKMDFNDICKKLVAIKELRTIKYETYNDEKDYIVKKNN